MNHFRVNSPNVLHEIIDGEAVLVNLESGSYYSIDRVGAVIWEAIENGLSANQIIENIASQYDGNYGDIKKGVQELFSQLEQEQLIVPNNTSQPNGQVPSVNNAINGSKLPFEPPVLHKYTDMEDLLLLDPIHDVDESGWPNTNPNNS